MKFAKISAFRPLSPHLNSTICYFSPMVRSLGRTVFGSQENNGKVLPQEDALAILNGWVSNERLRLHMRQVAGLMKAWALEKAAVGEKEAEIWYQAGLLHDADWEKYPSEHCRIIVEKLEELSLDPNMIHCIASHGPNHFGVDPENEMDHMIYCFDELSGFIHAVSLLRPTGYEGLEVKSVLKRLKTPSFAAQVSREEIQDAMQRAGHKLEDIIQFIIDHQSGIR